MTWDQILRAAWKQSGWSKRELSRRADVSYDNLLKYLQGAVDNPRGDTLDKLGRALQIDLRGGSAPAASHVPLMGYIGAGAEIEPEFEQVPPEGLDQIEVPFPLPEDMLAFGVKGDSMLPVYKNGATIITFREQKRPIEAFYGEDAAVRTAEGKRFIKTIMRGAEGMVNLFSWNAAPIENVRLDWIGEIFAVLPPATLRRVARQGGIQGQFRV